VRDETTLLLRDFESADLFSDVGLPLGDRFGPDTLTVESWNEAARFSRSRAWQNTKLRAQNDLTGYLAKHHSADYQCWNKIMGEIRPRVLQLVGPKLEAKIAEAAIRKPILDSAAWDLLSLMMESEYSHLVPPRFFAALGLIYLVGHCPCGWQGEYPDGKLVIY
jgi:hypothetical protein